jgi:hypothetical protein
VTDVSGILFVPSSGYEVDDTFVTWTHGKEVHGFLQHLNSICSYSMFSVDVVQNKQGTILRKYLGDQMIGRLSVTLCVKKPHMYGLLASRES